MSFSAKTIPNNAKVSMSKEPNSLSSARDNVVLVNLRNILAEIYGDVSSMRRIINDLELRASSIELNSSAINNWHNILEEVKKLGRVNDLINLVTTEYGSNQKILDVYNNYHGVATQTNRNDDQSHHFILEMKTFPLDLVFIPAGPFLMGHNPEEGIPDYETPQHKAILPDYWITKYPITNEQYAEFVRQTKKKVARQLGWYGQEPLPAKLNHPVAGVTFQEAREYCQWLSEQTNCICQLPTEAHWEKAARTTDGRIYPWGSEWQENRCNHSSNEITAVHTFPEQNEYGCCDMVGNIPEWTRSLWGERLLVRAREFCYPWQDDQRNNVNANHQIRRVYRGGSISGQRLALRCTSHGVALPSQRRISHGPLGFRVIVNLRS